METTTHVTTDDQPVASPTIGETTAPAGPRRWDPKGKRNLIIIGGVVGVALLLCMILFFWGDDSEAQKASTITIVDSNRPVMSGMLSDEERKKMREAEEAKIAQALRDGKSYASSSQQAPANVMIVPDPNMATVRDPNSMGNAGTQQAPQGDVRLNASQPAVVNAPAQAPTIDESRAKGLEDQMVSMMRAWGMGASADGKQQLSAYVRDSGARTAASGLQSQSSSQTGQSGGREARSGAAGAGAVVVAAFEQAYAAETISSIDTDSPGKLRARILTGPLAGAVVTGTARRSGTEGVAMDFNNASLNGRQIRISAYGVDMDTDGDVVRGNYDGRYMQRYVFPILAEGVKAYAGARAQTGTQVIAITVPGTGGTPGGITSGAQQTPAPTVEQAQNAMVSAGAGQVAQALKSGHQDGHVTLSSKTQFGIVFDAPLYQSDVGDPVAASKNY